MIVQGFHRRRRDVFNVNDNGGLTQVGPGADVKGKFGNVHTLEFQVRSGLAEHLIEDGAVELDTVDLALAVE